MLRSLALLATTCCALAAALPAQSTLVVGPGGFAQIDPAIQAARPGDTIRVTVGGLLDPFTLDRGVTLRADPGLVPIISNPYGSTALRDTIVSIPAGQTAEISGLDFVPALPVFGWMFHASLRVQGGTVRFVDCTMYSRVVRCGQGTPALQLRDAEVALHLCQIRGSDRFGIGLQAIDSRVSATDCLIRGGSGCWDSQAYSAEAVSLERSTLQACRLDVGGGNSPPRNSNYPAGHGIVVDAGSRLWISDSIVTGGTSGNGGGIGGDGIRNQSPTPALLRDVTLQAGAGTTPGMLARGPSRVVTELPTIWTSPALAPPRGASWTVHLQTAPDTVFALGFSTSLGTSAVPVSDQWQWLVPGLHGPEWVTRRADAQGRSDETLTLPNLPAASGVALWAQAAAVAGSDVLLSPVVGGQVW